MVGTKEEIANFWANPKWQTPEGQAELRRLYPERNYPDFDPASLLPGGSNDQSTPGVGKASGAISTDSSGRPNIDELLASIPRPGGNAGESAMDWKTTPEGQAILAQQKNLDFTGNEMRESLSGLKEAWESGESPISAALGQQARQQGRQDIATQAAVAGRGVYNPALQRASIMQQGRTSQAMSPAIVAMAAREQQQAQDTYLNALRGQGGFEMDNLKQMQTMELAMRGLDQNERRMLLQAMLANRGMDINQSQGDRAFWGNIISGAVGAAGKGGIGYLLSGDSDGGGGGWNDLDPGAMFSDQGSMGGGDFFGDTSPGDIASDISNSDSDFDFF